MIISRKIMMEVLPYLNIPQTEEITDELLQELELTREDVENGRNAALIKENQRQRRQMSTEMSSLPERPLKRTSTEMSFPPNDIRQYILCDRHNRCSDITDGCLWKCDQWQRFHDAGYDGR